ncbi:hypothetical protein IAU60_003300 [Kwoniella sp. DSM 27419]
MASTKTRRPAPGVVMSTPPPPSRSKGKYSEVEKQGLLQNFDLEVADKTHHFRQILTGTLNSFKLRQESEIVSIPRELRVMTLGELEAKWGGGWAGILQRIRRESFEARERVREEKEEKERDEVVKGKRKRNTVATNPSPDRKSKNARRDVAQPTSTRKPTRAPLSRSKRTSKTKSAPAAARAPSQGPSTLPQNHIFNPSLPSTSNRSAPSPLSKPSTSRSQSQSRSATKAAESSSSSRHAVRQRAASIASSRSSQPPSDSEAEAETHSGSEPDDDDAASASASGSGSGSGSEFDSDDLPDPEALEAKFLSNAQAQASKTPTSKSKSSRKKRGPSLIFRQSLAPRQLLPAAEASGSTRGKNRDAESFTVIELSDGRTIEFDALLLTPGRVDKELDEGGVGAEEKRQVQLRVHEAVVTSLRQRMEKWTV